MNYVLFREDKQIHGQGYFPEVYYSDIQNPRSTFPTSTENLDNAKFFPTARAAYDFGGQEHLDDWRVGKR